MLRRLCSSGSATLQRGLATKAKSGKKSQITPGIALNDALAQVKDGAKAKFDETVELSVNLNVDPRKSDQMVRGSATLPHSIGKNIRVAVFARGAAADDAEAAGAEFVGAEDLVEKVKGGFTDFDRAIAAPDVMPLVGRVAKILGPRGLMPNPKLGTVTPNVSAAVKSAKGGVMFRAEKAGIVHAPIGKVSQEGTVVEENARALIQALSDARPKGVKEPYIKGVHVCSTMGKGVAVDVTDAASQQ